MTARLSIATSGIAVILAALPALAGPARDDPSIADYRAILGTARPVSDEAVSIAARYLGTNPTGRRSLWCADFVALVERKAGRRGSGSRWARSYLGYGRPVPLSRARPGDIVVLWRGSPRGHSGHVGYFVGSEGGRVRLISGNVSNRVRYSDYPAGRVLGVRRP